MRENCLDDGEGILNFTYFHFCTMAGRSSLSFVCLSALVLLAFYLLGETAEEYFCPVVKKLTEARPVPPPFPRPTTVTTTTHQACCPASQWT